MVSMKEVKLLQKLDIYEGLLCAINGNCLTMKFVFIHPATGDLFVGKNKQWTFSLTESEKIKILNELCYTNLFLLQRISKKEIFLEPIRFDIKELGDKVYPCFFTFHENPITIYLVKKKKYKIFRRKKKKQFYLLRN